MKLLYIFIFLLSSVLAKAQYVAIPDVNFQTYLETEYPSCMSGGMLDTTCADVVNASTLVVTGLLIVDLEGVQYFDMLENLYCNQNLLTSLPDIHASLILLKCDSNNFTSLPALPSSLLSLFCSFNQLTNLPSLPTSLDFLFCPHNVITSLPALPATLTVLDVDDNHLTSLPVLPASLSKLFCGFNQLTSLPTLPSTLTFLYCVHNAIVSLPTLPSGITDFYCSYNQLTSLPTLPVSLIDFFCSYNQLTNLPDLPSTLVTIYCISNQLDCLPILPQGLKTLIAESNSIVCLPNLPPSPGFSSSIGTDTCSSLFNPNGCPYLISSTKNGEKDNSIYLYPNPSSGLIQIYSELKEEVRIKVFKADGKEVFFMDNVNFCDTLTIDLGREEKGIYLIQVISRRKVIYQKIVLN